MEFRIVTIPTLQLKGLMQEDNATGHTHGVPIFPKGVLMRVRPTCNPSRLAVDPFHPAPMVSPRRRIRPPSTGPGLKSSPLAEKLVALWRSRPIANCESHRSFPCSNSGTSRPSSGRSGVKFQKPRLSKPPQGRNLQLVVWNPNLRKHW